MTYDEFLLEWKSDSPAISCHTSGSTGEPKKILLPKWLLEQSALRTIRFFNLQPGSRFHSCISPEYIGGKMMAVRSILIDGVLTFETPSNSPLKNLDDGIIDLLAVVPSQMKYLVETDYSFENIKNVIIGGAPLPASLTKKIAEKGINAYETYGMTETASHIALKKITKQNSGFVPLDGIVIGLDDNNRITVSLPNPDAKNLYFVTNDIGEFQEDGSFMIKGRYDNIINSGGIKINPEIIERIIEEELELEVLITSEPDDKWGEKIIMIVDDNKMPVSDEEIYALCSRKLKKEMIPKSVIHAKIVKTANGKKKRK